MEYQWHIEDPGSQESNVRPTRMQSRSQGPGFIDDLDFEAYMGPVNEGFQPQIEARRNGVHQLPESPPDSGSENPYSPSETQAAHAIAVPQTILSQEYLLVHEHLPAHEILQQNGDYIYEELKSDGIDQAVLRNNLDDVIVLPQDPGMVELGIRQVRHEMGLPEYQNRYGQIQELDQGILNSQLVSLGHETLPPVYTSLQEPSVKKRKHSQDTNSQVKCEPALSPESGSQLNRAPPSVDGSEAGDDSALQCIRFAPFQQTALHVLYDHNLKPLQAPAYVVGADKGFNYSQIDEAFVCQKKNHFQVTCQIQVKGDPHYVKTADGFKKISSFCLHFYGVKAEDPSQEVRVEQSQSDRTKKPFHPVPIQIRRDGAKITVGRLHFAETTNNNMRKKGRPNPDQRHFQLVVALRAHTAEGDYMIAAHASDRIIVRASNPGQFESDCAESWWQRGVSENSVHFTGKVGINTDKPDESCVVNGNIKVTGHILHPSDARAKRNIEELDTAQQLKNVQSIRVVKFKYDPSFAEHSGLLGYDPGRPSPALDTGVIAQEVRQVLPEAVREAGDVALPNGATIPNFLVVNKDRIFMENLGAVKELCKVTGHLESRIDQLEKINRRLCRVSVLQRRDSSRSSISNDSRFSTTSNSSKSLYSDNISIDQIRDIARSIRKHECCHKMNHNSPKYTRKQCRNCHGNYTKFGKYYNYNKTSVRYHSGKSEKDGSIDNPTYVEPRELPDEKSSTFSRKQDTCLWLRDSDVYSYGNTRLGRLCYRRGDYGDAGGELISNKFLQIVITVLIFIMAVCLVVMSALYFREHQELIHMKEIRTQTSLNYVNHGGRNGPQKLPDDVNGRQNGPQKPPDDVNGRQNGTERAKSPIDQNQIEILKSSQQTKKSVKEKAPHKTTIEFTTATPTELPHTSSSTPHQSKIFISNNINSVAHADPSRVHADRSVVTVTRTAVTVGGDCLPIVNSNNNELDSDCQSSCGLDTPQTYENQEPLERSKPDKELNDTFTRPLEPIQRERLPNIPAIPERNTSDTLKIKSQGDMVPESNFLDGSKPNASEDIGGKFRKDRKWKRDTKDESRARRRAGASLEEMNISEQSKEVGRFDCDEVRIGLASQSVSNMSLFRETVCADVTYNFSYNLPLSHCLNQKTIEITFRSPKLVKEFHVCDVHCRYEEASKVYQQNWDLPKLSPAGDLMTVKVHLDCTMDRTLKIRSRFVSVKPHYFGELCCFTHDHDMPFVEFNIRIYRDCHN